MTDETNCHLGFSFLFLHIDIKHGKHEYWLDHVEHIDLIAYNERITNCKLIQTYLVGIKYYNINFTTYFVALCACSLRLIFACFWIFTGLISSLTFTFYCTLDISFLELVHAVNCSQLLTGFLHVMAWLRNLESSRRISSAKCGSFRLIQFKQVYMTWKLFAAFWRQIQIT